MKRRQTAGLVLRIVLPVLLLAAVLLPAWYSNKLYAYFPFFMILFLLLLCAVSAFVMRKHVRFSSGSQSQDCIRGEKVPMTLHVQNASFLICPKATAEMFISSGGMGKDVVRETQFTLAAGSTSRFNFNVRMDHLGVYRAGLQSMTVSDPLGLLRLPVPGRKELSVTVMPREITDHDITLNSAMLTDSHDQRKSTAGDGYDYSGIREYVPGDSMKRIHWKISAHSTSYMTKVTEISKREDMTVILDTTPPEVDGETLAFLFDALVEYALYFMRQARKLNVDHRLLYIAKSGEIRRLLIKGDDEVRELIRQVATPKVKRTEGFPDGIQLLQAERRIAGGSANVILCTAKIDSRLLRELASVRQQKRSPMLCYIMPHETDREGRRKAAAQLRLLDDMSIRYRIVLAEGPDQEVAS